MDYRLERGIRTSPSELRQPSSLCIRSDRRARRDVGTSRAYTSPARSAHARREFERCGRSATARPSHPLMRSGRTGALAGRGDVPDRGRGAAVLVVPCSTSGTLLPVVPVRAGRAGRAGRAERADRADRRRRRCGRRTGRSGRSGSPVHAHATPLPPASVSTVVATATADRCFLILRPPWSGAL